MPKGHNQNYYKYMIVDINTDEKHYFKETAEVREILGIKKGSLYNMLNDENHTCFKYKNQYTAFKCRKPVYEIITIDYREEFYQDE